MLFYFPTISMQIWIFLILIRNNILSELFINYLKLFVEKENSINSSCIYSLSQGCIVESISVNDEI